MGQFKDLTGQSFGKLIVIKRVGIDKHGNVLWLCKCECNKEIIVKSNSLKTKNRNSCGCVRKEHFIARISKPYRESSLNQAIGIIKRNAKRRNIPWGLSDKKAKELIVMNCHYCNAEPSQLYNHRKFNGQFKRNGLDRIDNNQGYIEDNVVPCCKWCNRAKRDMTYDEFKAWVKRSYEYLNSENNQP